MIGAVDATDAVSAVFAEGVDNPLYFCNIGTNDCFIRNNGKGAAANKGFCLFAGTSKAAKDISPQWLKNLSTGYTVICKSSESTTLTWST